MLKRTLALTTLLVSLGSLAACGGEEETPESATDPAASGGKTETCDYPAAEEAAKEVSAPSGEAPAEGTSAVTIATSIGDLKATLDSEQAPCTVNSFLSLAEQGYFDDTTCHRLTMPASGISVLQCGDPTASGTGGPGYTIADEVDGSEKYPAGTLAMAKTAAPDSGGSQFFIVYGETPLPAQYTVFGTVDEASLKLVADAASQGTTTGAVDGPPKVPVDIASVS